MGKKEKYLAKLIRAQLKQEEVPSLPEGVTVDEIVQIAKAAGSVNEQYFALRCAGAGTERAGKIV